MEHLKGKFASMRKSLRLFQLVFAIGIIFILISANINEHTIWKELSRDVGISFIVSFVTIMTVERVQRQEFNEFIEKAVTETSSVVSSVAAEAQAKFFLKIFSADLPDRIWEYIRNRIIKQAFYRTNSSIIYTIKLAESVEKKYGIPAVVLEADFRHTVANISGQDQIYEARCYVEKGASDLVAPEDAKKSLMKIFVNGKSLSEAEIKEADAKWEDTDDFLRHRYNLTVPAQESIDVRIVNRIYSKLIADTEVWRSTYACDELDFTIHFPSSLNVRVDALHPRGFELLHKSETYISGRIKEPLLPQNGFMFWWTPLVSGENPAAVHDVAK